MSRGILTLLALLPFVEVALLARLVASIGFINSLVYLLLVAMLGVSLIKKTGMKALMNTQQALQRGEVLAQEVATSGIAVLGGILLVIPGLLTDALGLLLLWPPIKQRLARLLLERPGFVVRSTSRTKEPDVLEGEFRRED